VKKKGFKVRHGNLHIEFEEVQGHGVENAIHMEPKRTKNNNQIQKVEFEAYLIG
jgi:hypothetical protein